MLGEPSEICPSDGGETVTKHRGDSHSSLIFVCRECVASFHTHCSSELQVLPWDAFVPPSLLITTIIWSHSAIGLSQTTPHLLCEETWRSGVLNRFLNELLRSLTTYQLSEALWFRATLSLCVTCCIFRGRGCTLTGFVQSFIKSKTPHYFFLYSRGSVNPLTAIWYYVKTSHFFLPSRNTYFACFRTSKRKKFGSVIGFIPCSKVSALPFNLKQ